MLCLKLFLTLRTTPIPKVHPPHGPLDPPPLSVIALSQQSRGAGLLFDIRHSFRRRKGHLEQVTCGDPEAVWSQGPRCLRKTPAALTKQTPRETLAPPYLLIFPLRSHFTDDFLSPKSLLLSFCQVGNYEVQAYSIDGCSVALENVHLL